MATDWTMPIILIGGAGLAIWAWKQGMFGQASADEVYNQAEFEATGVSTLCKCGSGRATHVGGDCASCKSYCSETCGNCSPQCITSGTKKSKPASSKLIAAQNRQQAGTFSTNKPFSPTLKKKVDDLVNKRTRAPLVSTLCQCGSARPTHVIGNCTTCKNRCRTICGNCTPQCRGTRSNFGEEDYYSAGLIPSLVGREDAYEEPLYFSGIGYVGDVEKRYGVEMSLPSISQQGGPF